MKTVRDEIYRIYNLNIDKKKFQLDASTEAMYYSDLLDVHDMDMSLDEFYKLYPYHNPDITSDYWNQQHNKWKEIWTQDKI